MYIKNNNAFITVSPTLEELKALSSAQRVKENEFGITINDLFALVKRADVNPVLRVTTNAGNTVEYVFTNMTKGTFQSVVYYTLKFVSGDDVLSLVAYPSASNYGVSFKGYGAAVTVTPVVTEGTTIARVTIDGTIYNIKTPNVTAGNKVNVVPLLDELIAAASDEVELSIEDDLDEDQLAVVTALQEYISHYDVMGGEPDAAYPLTQFYTDDSEAGTDIGNEIFYPAVVFVGESDKSGIVFYSKVNRNGLYARGPKSMMTSFDFYTDQVTEKAMIGITRRFADLNDHTYTVSTSGLGIDLPDALEAAFDDVTPNAITADTKLVLKSIDAEDSTLADTKVYTLVQRYDEGSTTTHFRFTCTAGGYEAGETDEFAAFIDSIFLTCASGVWTAVANPYFSLTWDGTDLIPWGNDNLSAVTLVDNSTITITDLEDYGNLFI